MDDVEFIKVLVDTEAGLGPTEGYGPSIEWAQQLIAQRDQWAERCETAEVEALIATRKMGQAERDGLAWKESALNQTHDTQALLERLTHIRHEINLMKRERKVLSLTIRNVVEGGGDVRELLDLIASLSQPLREGEGLLAEEETSGP